MAEEMGCLFGWLFGGSKKETPKVEEPTPNPEAQEAAAQDKRADYKDAYQRKYLLTKNEWTAHRKLREIAEAKNLIVCPKVRMLDIVEPRRGEKDYKTLFYKIQAKHLDFVICDEGMRIKAIVELDDNSHDQKSRKERDNFVDEVLESVGYKVIRTRYINDNILDELVEKTEQ